MTVINFPNKEERAPEFIQPVDLFDMTDEQLDTLLEGIRARRMLKQVLYRQTLALKEEAKTRGMEDRLNRKLAQFNKQLGILLKNEEKLETLANEVRGLRIQLGHDPL